MLNIKGIEASEGDLRGIKWIMVANVVTYKEIVTIPDHVTEKSTNNVVEPLKWNEKINTLTTFYNKKCY